MSHHSHQSQDSSQRSQYQLHQHHRLPDLVRDSKLNTQFLSDTATQHTVYVTRSHGGRRRRTRVEEVWHREHELGNGTFGHVWMERCGSGPSAGSLRAVKEMQMDPSMPVDYSRELEAMTKFSHEKYVDCFVRCYGWYMSENLVFIAMEHLEHGDLQKYLHQPFPEDQVKEIASQLTEGLVHMHENGFAHRDLKPANILVHKPGPNWWVKIGDFGISKRAEEEKTALRTLIGTEGYLAPEIIGFVFTQDPSESQVFSYTFAVDMWALGELTFRMIAQRPAFPNRQDLFNCVVRGHPFPLSVLEAFGASLDCRDFIKKSMIADPGNRLTAYDASIHPWLQLSRPSSRASSASSKRRSEVPTISSNPSIQNGHLTATPSDPQLENSFDNTAQWSTGFQGPQNPQSANSFDNTAQWSTGLQEPHHLQSTSPFDNTARWSTGIQEPHHLQPTSSFDSTAKWSTGFQGPQNPQALQDGTEGVTSTFDQSGYSTLKQTPVTITSSLDTARPSSTVSGSSSNSLADLQTFNELQIQTTKGESSATQQLSEEERHRQKEFQQWLADRPRRMEEAAMVEKKKNKSRRVISDIYQSDDSSGEDSTSATEQPVTSQKSTSQTPQQLREEEERRQKYQAWLADGPKRQQEAERRQMEREKLRDRRNGEPSRMYRQSTKNSGNKNSPAIEAPATPRPNEDTNASWWEASAQDRHADARTMSEQKRKQEEFQAWLAEGPKRQLEAERRERERERVRERRNGEPPRISESNEDINVSWRGVSAQDRHVEVQRADARTMSEGERKQKEFQAWLADAPKRQQEAERRGMERERARERRNGEPSRIYY
ncbi:hypothetical protein G7Z17_g8853 [Cylindrodendrum hubeiense]|uniref:non-specific serine/threonine protein kinase n=1 Tax=Cylindrodendrum hubeiense TaxID=595255 RepID=A0A9P5H545_9HYPO|nr:hypothetical protein G7Z17_g8853 [Cylindrodendrum hubeiense]